MTDKAHPTRPKDITIHKWKIRLDWKYNIMSQIWWAEFSTRKVMEMETAGLFDSIVDNLKSQFDKVHYARRIPGIGPYIRVYIKPEKLP